MDPVRFLALEACDRIVGLELSDVAADCCIMKAPCGGERTGGSPVDRARSTVVDARGITLGTIVAPANRHDPEVTGSSLVGSTLTTRTRGQKIVHLGDA